IYPAIAGAVGFTLEAAGQASRPPAQQVLDYLCQKQLLLILDNFEHLLSGANTVVEILKRAEGVKILATSRERLSLREEHILSIQGLDFPAARGAQKAVSDYTAVQLFVQAARRVQYDFELTEADEAHVGRICGLVYGMPLGVELAASWVDMLPLADIAAEIEQSLDFLEATVRNIPTRQRSLRAVFDTTWQRLTPEEQDTFVRLSVFRGGFTREAGQRITGASLMMLSKLVN